MGVVYTGFVGPGKSWLEAQGKGRLLLSRGPAFPEKLARSYLSWALLLAMLPWNLHCIISCTSERCSIASPNSWDTPSMPYLFWSHLILSLESPSIFSLNNHPLALSTGFLTQNPYLLFPWNALLSSLFKYLLSLRQVQVSSSHSISHNIPPCHSHNFLLFSCVDLISLNTKGRMSWALLKELTMYFSVRSPTVNF